MNSRITSFFMIVLASGAAVAQESSSPKQRPTLTNEDILIERSARGQLTWEELTRRLELQQSFRARFKMNAGLVETSASLEVVFPDRVHAIETDNRASTVVEAIVIGPSFYYRMNGSREWKQQALSKDQSNLPMLQFVTQFKWLLHVPLIVAGGDDLDGTQAIIYLPAQKIAGSAEQDLKLWVRSSDGLPLKIVNKSKSLSATYELTFYDYNQPITIRPPVQ